MLIQTLSIDDPRWKNALSRLPHDVYHTPEYVRIDARRMQATPGAVLVSDGSRELFLPYLLRSCAPLFPGVQESVLDVVSPYGYPGIVLSDTGREPEFATAAWSAICERWNSNGACAAFLRMHPILGAESETLFPPGVMIDSGQTVAVDLQLDDETIWSQISHGHRNTLEKCRKHGFSVKFVPLGDVLDPFIDVYEQTMDRVRAKDSYYFSREYFAALADIPGVHCGVVQSGDQIAAACVFFESHGIVQAHLGGTATNYFSHSPFHLCLHQAMLWAKQRGNRWLHLGGGLGGTNDQLLKFKAGFSRLQFRFHTARVVLDEAQYMQLVEKAALASNCSPESLLKTKFFPAYRS